MNLAAVGSDGPIIDSEATAIVSACEPVGGRVPTAVGAFTAVFDAAGDGDGAGAMACSSLASDLDPGLASDFGSNLASNLGSCLESGLASALGSDLTSALADLSSGFGSGLAGSPRGLSEAAGGGAGAGAIPIRSAIAGCGLCQAATGCDSAELPGF